jgi:SsrA-binding protein
MNTKKTPNNSTIALNKKARFDFELEEKFEAGVALQGWEVKSLRAGKGQITDTYVLLKNGEAWLIGALITPISTVSTHFVIDPRRTRKLLLSRRELNKLIGATQQKGYTCVCTAMYWKNHLVKVEIALAKGKQKHDKRETEKERDWDREKQRVVRHANKGEKD